MKSTTIFFASAFVALAVLALERLAGIGWDFHPDAVTYTTMATDFARGLLAESYFLVLNNGYYFWADFWGMNLFILTAANIMMFSLTNVFLYRFHEKHVSHDMGQLKWLITLAILLTNPYRLHLATTVLKDTMIIMFVVLFATVNIRRHFYIVPMLIVLRLASILYFVTKLKRRALVYFILVALVVCALFAGPLADRLTEFNSADMQLREFDQVPNFRELGLLGVFLRGATWPFLAITGFFAVISPAMAFYPVALGSILNQLYCFMVTRKLALPLVVLVPMAVFGALVTGYTAYIRYVYPLIVVLPLFAIEERRRTMPMASSDGVTGQ